MILYDRICPFCDKNNGDILRLGSSDTECCAFCKKNVTLWKLTPRKEIPLLTKDNIAQVLPFIPSVAEIGRVSSVGK